MNDTQQHDEDDVTDEISSPYLKGVDLPNTPTRATIKVVTLESFPNSPDDPPKRVVAFYELKKRLICNKTQLRSLAEAFGPSTAGWRSKEVLLERMMVTYAGKPVVSIHISPASAKTQAAADDSNGDVVFGGAR